MAWVQPKTRVVGEQETAAGLNEQRKANLDVLSIHVHDGTPGEGASVLVGLDTILWSDDGAPGTTGLLKRHGAHLKYGASDYIITNEDPVAATAGLRSLRAQADGTADEAVAGNHTLHG